MSIRHCTSPTPIALSYPRIVLMPHTPPDRFSASALTPHSLFFFVIRPPPPSPLFPYTTLFRSATCPWGPRCSPLPNPLQRLDRKSTRLNSSHVAISYAVFCLKKKIAKAQKLAETAVTLKNEFLKTANWRLEQPIDYPDDKWNFE